MGSLLAFLNKNLVRSVIAALGAVAVVVKTATGSHTVAHQVADKVIEGAAVVGAYASSSRIVNP